MSQYDGRRHYPVTTANNRIAIRELGDPEYVFAEDSPYHNPQHRDRAEHEHTQHKIPRDFFELGKLFFYWSSFPLVETRFLFRAFYPDNLRVFTGFVLTYYYRITGVQRVISKAAKHLSPF